VAVVKICSCLKSDLKIKLSLFESLIKTHSRSANTMAINLNNLVETYYKLSIFFSERVWFTSEKTRTTWSFNCDFIGRNLVKLQLKPDACIKKCQEIIGNLLILMTWESV